MNDFLIFSLYFGLPLVVFITIYVLLQNRKSHRAMALLTEAKEAGMSEPVSLHPLIDPNKCLGCATCVSACPEGKILGLVKRKAVLVSPTSCIGHGACRESCPTDAISLVFGSETRGVEIPLLSPDFETSVEGIYISGELGGMGLIKNAITQGLQAVEAIAKKIPKHSLDYDLVIVGAGPAGLSAGLAAQEKKLRYVILEQDTIGGAVAHYPRGKIAMTQPAVLPLVGEFQFREASKEALIEFWQKIIDKVKLRIDTGQNVKGIAKLDNGFSLETGKKQVTANKVLLALGRRGTPRKLDVPGEELPKVVYRLIDPAQYTNQHVLVVGGGDSALEAALAISEEQGTTTALSYRSAAFSRAKVKNRERVEAAVASGKLSLLMESKVKQVTEKSVIIACKDKDVELQNDSIIVCAGGVLPTPFLRKAGIEVEEKFGTA